MLTCGRLVGVIEEEAEFDAATCSPQITSSEEVLLIDASEDIIVLRLMKTGQNLVFNVTY